MQVGVGFCDNPDSEAAGRQAAEAALKKSGRTDICSFVLLFNTARHNQQQLMEAVAGATGNSEHIYGGGAVGIITNDAFGYAGDQVGVACIWLDDSECTILVEKDLDKSEKDAGARLGGRLAQLGTKPDSPVLLFYDAIDRKEGGMRLLMATWLLEGIEKELGYFPNLTGAGMQGDHLCSPTKQYIGSEIAEYTAISLSFSDDISIDSVIMHGCRPASPYYTVTRAEGPVILEINGKPALKFMDELLGPAIKPENYPFFLLFGINQGERWGEYDENNYASRLCLGIDKERGGIVMFEPDMVAGTEFQLMFRSLDLDYMKPKIDSLFERLDGREPLFAMYIDCAGRCAGYGGVDIEDAFVIQEAVQDRIPLLGLYTGVEIASVGKVTRGLDWTGVFLVFTKNGDKQKNQPAVPVRQQRAAIPQNSESPVEAMVRLCEQNAAKILALDNRSIQIRHELEQKRRGFRLLAELSVSLRHDKLDDIFQLVTQRINAALNMQRTIVLLPDKKGRFIPSILQGYGIQEHNRIAGMQLQVDAELLNTEKPIIVTGADAQERFGDLRTALNLPFFISAPVVVRDEAEAILITGRMMEAAPFLSRLGNSDAETVQAISGLLASVLVYQKLDDANRQAQLDGLTGILNRGGLISKCTQILTHKLVNNNNYAFLIIDFDHFKDVNDTYGHLAGDAALISLAQMLRRNFRSTDLVARIGGDEFAVVYAFNGDIEHVSRKAAGLLETWTHTPVILDQNNELYASLSIGISVAPKDGKTYSELFRKADLALYKAKEDGRSRYAVYDENTMRTIK